MLSSYSDLEDDDEQYKYRYPSSQSPPASINAPHTEVELTDVLRAASVEPISGERFHHVAPDAFADPTLAEESDLVKLYTHSGDYDN
jgi:hypothetical protein